MSSLQKPASYGVIFDMDGVLVDSSVAHFEAWSQLGRAHGKPFSRALFEETFGMHNQQILPLWLGDGVPDANLRSLSEEKEAAYRSLVATDVQPLEGAVGLVRSLAAAGFRLSVGSSAPGANVDLILRCLDLTELFQAQATGDEVREGKPDPEVFLLAAEKLGLPPASCVVIEDAPQGVAAGLAAGARVVAVTSSRPAGDLAAAHLVVDSLAELDPATLEGILRS